MGPHQRRTAQHISPWWKHRRGACERCWLLLEHVQCCCPQLHAMGVAKVACSKECSVCDAAGCTAQLSLHTHTTHTAVSTARTACKQQTPPMVLGMVLATCEAAAVPRPCRRAALLPQPPSPPATARALELAAAPDTPRCHSACPSPTPRCRSRLARGAALAVCCGGQHNRQGRVQLTPNQSLKAAPKPQQPQPQLTCQECTRRRACPLWSPGRPHSHPTEQPQPEWRAPQTCHPRRRHLLPHGALAAPGCTLPQQ